MSNTGLRYAIHFYRRNLIREFSNSTTKVCKITIRHTNRSNLQLPSDNTTAKDKHPCSAASWRWRYITNSDLGTAPKLIFSNDVKIVETLHNMGPMYSLPLKRWDFVITFFFNNRAFCICNFRSWEFCWCATFSVYIQYTIRHHQSGCPISCQFISNQQNILLYVLAKITHYHYQTI